MKKTLAVVVLLVFAAPVWAGSCPVLMGHVDEGLANDVLVGDLGANELERVRELRRQGQEYHEAGEHGRSVEALGEAKRILGL